MYWLDPNLAFVDLSLSKFSGNLSSGFWVVFFFFFPLEYC